MSFVLIFLLSNNGQEYLLWNGEEIAIAAYKLLRYVNTYLLATCISENYLGPGECPESI